MQPQDNSQKSFEKSLNLSFLAIGVGIAYGIFGTGYFLSWKLEAVLLAAILTVIAPAFKLWSFREYQNECRKAGQEPKIFIYLILQMITNSLKIFLPAFLIIGGKYLFGIEHIDGRVWLLKRPSTASSEYTCTRFKETPETLLKSANEDNASTCTLQPESEWFRISCAGDMRMYVFLSESECLKFGKNNGGKSIK